MLQSTNKIYCKVLKLFFYLFDRKKRERKEKRKYKCRKLPKRKREIIIKKKVSFSFFLKFYISYIMAAAYTNEIYEFFFKYILFQCRKTGFALL